jgi:hypothetical protein
MTQHTLSTPLIVPSPAAPQGQETPRQHTVARLLGASSFATIPWQRLMQHGALVELHIGRCRFSTRLLLEDIGIQIEDEAVRDKLARWLVLGEKRLLPQAYMKALSRIESSARYTLREHAFHTALGHFVPETAYVAWRTKTEALRDEYLALRDDIIAHHRGLVHQVLAEYEAIAADTYQRLRATRPDLVLEGQQQFVAAYCNRIADQIPSIERIRASFSFQFFRVEGTHLLGTPPTEASDEAVSGPESEAQETDLLAASRQQREHHARARALLEQDLRHDAQERFHALLDNFLTTIVAQMRTLTYDAATDVLATLQRRGGESFSPRSKVQLENLLNRLRSLNFFADPDMDQIMARLQEIVDLAPQARQRSLGDIERTLRAIATTTRATLLDLEEETRAPRPDLGIAAYPTAHLISAARAELRLPPLDLAHLASLPAETRAGTGRAEFSGNDQGPLWQFVEHQRTARTL